MCISTSFRWKFAFEEAKSTLVNSKCFEKQWCDTKNSSVSWELHHAMSHLIFAHISVSSSRLNAVHQWSNPKKSSAGLSPMKKPVSSEKNQESDELCEADVCFLHIQLIGTNALLPNMHNVPSEINFESSRSPAMSESWNISNLHCCAAFSHDITICIQSWDGRKRSNELNVCLVLCLIVRWLTKFQVHQFVLNTDIAGKFENFFWTIPFQFQFFSSLNWWSSTHKVVIFLSCWAIFFVNSQKKIHLFLGMTFHIVGSRGNSSFFRSS